MTARRSLPPTHGPALGIRPDPGFTEGSRRSTAGEGVLLYTDGLTEALGPGQAVRAPAASAVCSSGLNRPSPAEAVAILRARVADFAYGSLTDDLCLLAARIA